MLQRLSAAKREDNKYDFLLPVRARPDDSDGAQGLRRFAVGCYDGVDDCCEAFKGPDLTKTGGTAAAGMPTVS